MDNSINFNNVNKDILQNLPENLTKKDINKNFGAIFDLIDKNKNGILNKTELINFFQDIKNQKSENTNDNENINTIYGFYHSITEENIKELSNDSVYQSLKPQYEIQNKINDIKENNKYTREKNEKNGNTYVYSQNGDYLGCYDDKSVMLHIPNSNKGTAYSSNGEEALYSYEIQDMNAVKMNAQHKPPLLFNKFYSDHAEVDKSPEKTILYSLYGDSTMLGSEIGEIKTSYDEDGNISRQILIDKKNKTKTTLDSNVNGSKINYTDGKLIYNIYSDLDEKNNVIFQTRVYPNGSITSINNMQNRKNTNDRTLQNFAINTMASDIDSALKMMLEHKNNRGFFSTEWEGLNILGNYTWDAITGRNDYKTEKEFTNSLQDMKEAFSHIRAIALSDENFQQKFKEATGIEFNPTAIQNLHHISKKVQKISILTALSKSLDECMNGLTPDSIKTKQEQYSIVYKTGYEDVIKTLSTIMGQDNAADYVKKTIAKYSYGGDLAITTALKGYLYELKTSINAESEKTRGGISDNILEQQMRSLYSEAFGNKMADFADTYITNNQLGASILEALTTIVTAGGTATTIGTKLTPIIGKNAAKLVTITGGAAVSSGIHTADEILSPNMTNEVINGEFDNILSNSFNTFKNGLLYSAIGGYITGPAGEKTANYLMKYLSANSAKTTALLNKSISTGIETSLDAVFENLLSDKDMIASLEENGIMNLSQMYIGGRINELFAKYPKLKEATIKQNKDGSYTLKNGLSEITLSNTNELCKTVLGIDLNSVKNTRQAEVQNNISKIKKDDTTTTTDKKQNFNYEIQRNEDGTVIGIKSNINGAFSPELTQNVSNFDLVCALGAVNNQSTILNGEMAASRNLQLTQEIRDKSGLQANVYEKGDEIILAVNGFHSAKDIQQGAYITKNNRPELKYSGIELAANDTQLIKLEQIYFTYKKLAEAQGKKLIIAGYSMGGAMTRLVAIKHSEDTATRFVSFNALGTGNIQDRNIESYVIKGDNKSNPESGIASRVYKADGTPSSFESTISNKHSIEAFLYCPKK